MSGVTELPLNAFSEDAIDSTSGTPLYIQIRDQLLAIIKDPAVRDGSRFPSEPALSKRYRVSKMTVRQAISDVVAEGHLVRKRGSGTFVVRQTRFTVAAITPYRGNPLYVEWFDAMEEEMAAGNYVTQLYSSKAGDPYEQAVAEEIIASKPTAALVIGISSDAANKIAAAGIPIIGIMWPLDWQQRWPDLPRERVNVLCADRLAGYRLMIEHLHQQGHRRLGFLGFKTDPFKLNLVKTAIQDHPGHLSISEKDTIMLSVSTENESHLLALMDGVCQQWLEQWREDQPHRASVILANSDQLAAQFMAALASRGISIPRDLSIVGYDGVSMGAYLTPSLTTVGLQMSEAARHVCQLTHLAREGVYSQTRTVYPHLIKRQSVAVLAPISD